MLDADLYAKIEWERNITLYERAINQNGTQIDVSIYLLSTEVLKIKSYPE